MSIANHKEKINLDVMKIPGHDIILGMPWLKTHAPYINWRTEEITFPDEQCTKHLATAKRTSQTPETRARARSQSQESQSESQKPEVQSAEQRPGVEASSSARVQEISLAAIRRMRRRGDKVYHLHLRPSTEMEQRIIARMQRPTGPPAEDNSLKSVGGDCPQRIHARYTNAADVPTMLRQNISPTCNSAKRERTLHGYPTGGKPIPIGNLASEKTYRELGGKIRPKEEIITLEK